LAARSHRAAGGARVRRSPSRPPLVLTRTSMRTGAPARSTVPAVQQRIPPPRC
jgi:hypothetical protein